MSELKPCPFCGSNDLQDMCGYITCQNCDADGPMIGMSDWAKCVDCTEKWNKRAHPTCETCRQDEIEEEIYEEGKRYVIDGIRSTLNDME